MAIEHVVAAALDQLPSRLRRAREKRDLTLSEVSSRTGISSSTLSRLESGQRRPTIELVLRVAMALEVPLADLVAAPSVQDPRVQLAHARVEGRTVVPLTRQNTEPRAYKLVIPATESKPSLRTHQGYEWLYVLSGTMRLRLGPHDVHLGPGEVAEFPTEQPHWFGSTGRGPVELLSLFGTQGEMMHVRAHTRRKGDAERAKAEAQGSDRPDASRGEISPRPAGGPT
ncbi:helix-turn-helix domain-containing protein [Microbacterium sp. MYb64]|uniref:helix-turn-helix domain-containing protein n=1 Tax=Microbacterium sp. MYb64 TaxID=1848691 RepID=UPI000CFDC203|nr:XRE family transcriptional regulator [Microbacterium sp. MYb64]PRB00972.1 XRE family transcriptional regulator [Microbacterium sp. MYb64]